MFVTKLAGIALASASVITENQSTLSPYSSCPAVGRRVRLLVFYGSRHTRLRTDQEEKIMLQLRPNCECCDKDLPPASTEAKICSFECTFCENCSQSIFEGICPNCGGELVARPRRPASKLVNNPPSTIRIHQPAGCKKSDLRNRVA